MKANSKGCVSIETKLEAVKSVDKGEIMKGSDFGTRCRSDCRAMAPTPSKNRKVAQRKMSQSV
jgi:hypothetical protein